MSEASFTLKHFFSQEAGDGLALAELESSKRMTRLRRLLASRAKKLSWAVAFSEISLKIPDLLDIDVAEILSAAWETSTKIDAYLKRSEREPTEAFLVHLAEHKLHSSHEPHLEIRLNGEEVSRIHAEIRMELLIEAAVLKIQAGRICEVRTGSCQGKGSFSIEGIRILEKKTREIELPGTLRLDPREELAEARGQVKRAPRRSLQPGVSEVTLAK